MYSKCPIESWSDGCYYLDYNDDSQIAFCVNERLGGWEGFLVIIVEWNLDSLHFIKAENHTLIDASV